MKTRILFPILLGALACANTSAQPSLLAEPAAGRELPADNDWETRWALGIAVALGGPDLQVTWRRAKSPWEYGIRYVTWKNETSDPYTGRSLGTTTETMVGPTLNYVFRPTATNSPYLGSALYYWSIRDEYTNTRETPSAATAGLFLGGGWSFVMSKHSYANLGLLVAVSGSMSVGAAGNYTEADGIDLLAQVGLRF